MNTGLDFMSGSRAGTGGPDPTLENHKNIGFLSDTGPATHSPPPPKKKNTKLHSKIVIEYDQKIPQSQTAEKHGTARKSNIRITRHQENKLSKATSSLFPIKDDCKTGRDIK